MSEEGTVAFEISGDVDIIRGKISEVIGFTAGGVDAAISMRAVCIDASDPDRISFMAAAESAITRVFYNDGAIQVDTPGVLSISGHILARTLSVIDSGNTVTIRVINEQNQIDTFNNRPDAVLQLLDNGVRVVESRIGNEGQAGKVGEIDVALIPWMGTYDADNFAQINPYDFGIAFGSVRGSRSHSDSGGSAVLEGVFCSFTGDEPYDEEQLKGIALAMDGKTSYAVASFPFVVGGEGIGDQILHPSTVDQALGYMNSGAASSRIHQDESGSQLHWVALDEEGRLVTHLRTPKLLESEQAFPTAKTRASLDRMAQQIMVPVCVDHASFSKRADNAATIGSLSGIETGGSGREITLTLDSDSIEFTVQATSSYQKSLPYQILKGEKGEVIGDAEVIASLKENPVSFVFKYGIHGHVLATYSNPDHQGELRFGIMMARGKTGGGEPGPLKPFALAFYREAPTVEDSEGSIHHPDYMVSVRIQPLVTR